MKKTAIWALAVLNAGLLAMLVSNFLPANAAKAQGRPGEYLVIAGEIPGGQQAVYYVIDSRGLLSAVVVDENTGRISAPGAPIDLVKNLTPAP